MFCVPLCIITLLSVARPSVETQPYQSNPPWNFYLTRTRPMTRYWAKRQSTLSNTETGSFTGNIRSNCISISPYNHQ